MNLKEMKQVDGFHRPDGRPKKKSVSKDKIYTVKGLNPGVTVDRRV